MFVQVLRKGMLYVVIIYKLFWWAVAHPCCIFYITQQQIGEMERTDDTDQERVEHVPQIPAEVADAEVGTLIG